MVAGQFRQVGEAMGPEITKNELVSNYVALMNDSEAEVRTASALNITQVCQLFPKDAIINQVLPCVKQLVTDKSEHVRAALAGEIMGLAPILEKDNTIKVCYWLCSL